MDANKDHAPLLTTEDLHAMTDDALREIIRLCASQSRIYRAAPVYLPWYRLGAQALAELDKRTFDDILIAKQERDFKAEERAHEDELDDSLDDSVEEEEAFCARAKAAHLEAEELWKMEEEHRAKIEAAYGAARKAPPLGPEIKF